MFLNRISKKSVVTLGIMLVFLSACTSNETPLQNFTESELEPTPTTETLKPTNTKKVYPKKPTEMPPLPLSNPGPYHVGIRRNINFVDTSRNDRAVNLTIWYPALKPDQSVKEPISDAIADVSTGPYPVLMSSSKVGFTFADLLVSYGFVYVGINRIDTYEFFTQEVFDQPLDFLFALDQISQTPIEGLEGVLNTDLVGTLGYSFDGTNSLLLSGVRINPDYYLSYCKQAQILDPPLKDWYFHFYCDLSQNWQTINDYIGPGISESEDGLWQPITDSRIKAVMPMAPDGAWFLGETGLAAADRAILMIQASQDSEYQPAEGAFIFDHLGSSDKTMVSFIGEQHMMIFAPKQIARMGHFAVAFFSHQLQEKQDMAFYYSKEFLEQYPDLAFGFYGDK